MIGEINLKLIKTILGLLLTFSLFATLPGCGGGGSSSGGNGGNGGVANYKYYTYIANGKNVSIYTMDYTVGTFSTSTVEYPISVGYPRAMVQHPSKPYLYITSGTSGTYIVSVLSITPATGGLTEIQTIATSGYEDIEITPDGKYLYTSGAGPITCYKVSVDGKLTEPELDYYTYPNHIKVAPDGNVLYATYSYQEGSSWAYYLAAYNINGNDGTLTQTTRIDFTETPNNIAVFGQFVYNTTSSNKICQYYEGAGLTQNSYISSTDSNFGPIIANRGYLFAAKPGTNQIAGFMIDASKGSLTEFSGTGYPYATGTTSYIPKLSIDPGGKYLYAVDEDNKALLGYSIAPNGGLTKLNWNVTVPGIPYSALIAKVRQ